MLRIKQSRNKIIIKNIKKSPENKLGGYLWLSKCKLYDNEHLVGYYTSREANVISKGTLYFLLNRVGNFMVGKWVGCNYDYELTWGFGVIARDKNIATEKMQKLLTIERGITHI